MPWAAPRCGSWSPAGKETSTLQTGPHTISKRLLTTCIKTSGHHQQKQPLKPQGHHCHIHVVADTRVELG
jgi:hypothetical protein